MADAANAPAYSTPQSKSTKTKIFEWDLNGVSTGKAVPVADFRDRTFQVNDKNGTGAWGFATCVLEGCCSANGDPDHSDHANAVFGTLSDTTETPLSFTDDSGAPIQVLQGPVAWVRPKTSGGINTNIRAVLNVGK